MDGALMAMKAEDALTTALEADTEKLRQLEEEIDREIMRQFAPGEEVYVGLSNQSKRIGAELVRRYEHAGWKVIYHHATDQRDNDSIRLRPKAE
jgi:hypothetical protein